MNLKYNNMPKTEEEYRQKKAEILAKFTKDFIASAYQNDAATHATIENLIHGTDPYEVIQWLLEDRKKIVKSYTDAIFDSSFR